MSPSVSVTKRARTSKDGKRSVRYIVRFRLGGKYSRPIHAGSFKTLREAEERRRWIAGELAGMRVPNLRALDEVEASPTVPAAVRQWLAGRHDLTEDTRRNYGPAIDRIADYFVRTKVAEMTPRLVNEWIGDLIDDGVGRTVIDRCMSALRQGLDEYLDPNPARHRSVSLPRSERVEANPPPFAHWQLILDGVTAKVRLPLRVLEGTGLRVGELQRLTWGDVDFPGGRLFVRGGKTKAARRWVPVPAGLIEDIERLVPREDREPEGRVFPGLLAGSLRMAMRRATRAAGIPLYSPHDLRHRYITLLVRQGMDPAAVSARAGHTRKSMTLDVYSHLLIDEEMR
ncbi:MAG: site-specific integrase [Actinobacteria bacterium]|nr:site-specific integrase [Actinomycetota bacterium]